MDLKDLLTQLSDVTVQEIEARMQLLKEELAALSTLQRSLSQRDRVRRKHKADTDHQARATK